MEVVAPKSLCAAAIQITEPINQALHLDYIRAVAHFSLSSVLEHLHNSTCLGLRSLSPHSREKNQQVLCQKSDYM